MRLNLDSNYICMSMPYIAIFSYELDKWAKALKLKMPQFTKEEKEYYESIRLKHKLFEMDYNEVYNHLNEILNKQDRYYSSECNPLIKMVNLYYNIGVDIINDKYCGNTVLCKFYNPFINDNYTNGELIQAMSCICGKLIKAVLGDEIAVVDYNLDINTNTKDFNYYRNAPLKKRDLNSLVLFSIVCSINFLVEFIDKILLEEVTTKLRWGYLQYFYLVNFVKQINEKNKIELKIDGKLYNKQFRNCMAHYGLGVILNEENINENEKFGGITQNLFDLNYLETKKFIFSELKSLSKQIEMLILK